MLESLLVWIHLPTKLVVGVFFAAVLLLGCDEHLFSLTSLGASARNWVTAGMLASFGIGGVGLVADLARYLRTRNRLSNVKTEKAARQQAEKEKLASDRATILRRLDYIQAQERVIVAKALRMNAQSIWHPLHDYAVTTMSEKGLLIRHTGEHDSDRWPCTFPDFVWTEILRRREKFEFRTPETKRRESGQ